jgi:hypothetical protein
VLRGEPPELLDVARHVELQEALEGRAQVGHGGLALAPVRRDLAEEAMRAGRFETAADGVEEA